MKELKRDGIIKMITPSEIRSNLFCYIQHNYNIDDRNYFKNAKSLVIAELTMDTLIKDMEEEIK